MEIARSGKVFLIIHVDNLGGAEKRLLGMWIYLIENNLVDISLVCNAKFLEVAKSLPEYPKDFFINFLNKIILHEFNVTSIFKFNKSVSNFSRLYATSEDVLHFTSDLPIFHKGPKLILTAPYANLSYFNLKGKLAQYYYQFKANILDVLNPLVYKKFKWNNFFYKKVYLTPNSYIDTNYYQPALRKDNNFVFLGRFQEQKGVVKLLQAIPDLCNLLKNKGINDFVFYLIGFDGGALSTIKNLMKSEVYKKLPIEIFYDPNPKNILAKSKIFFSLQRHSNYPSKSLLEAISCGNIPIVTDCGETEKIAPRGTSVYIPEFFTTKDLVNAISKIYDLTLDEQSNIISKNRNFVKENFSLEKMANYYLSLYKKLLLK